MIQRTNGSCGNTKRRPRAASASCSSFGRRPLLDFRTPPAFQGRQTPRFPSKNTHKVFSSKSWFAADGER